MPFKKLLRENIVPEKGTSLQRQFEENPRLLLKEVGYPHGPEHSVISLAIPSLGKLHIADLILKPNGDNFTKNADPFYLGKDYLPTDTLPTSAGINFYLALITWQYFSQKAGLSELSGRTYYDLFYWENKNDERCYTCNEKNPLEQGIFMRAQADWFMQLADKVFKLEEQLRQITQHSETLIGKFSSIFITESSEKSEIYTKLGDYYLHIAYMETDHSATFSYFIRKSYEYYSQSEYHNTQAINQLAELVEKIQSNPIRVWNKIDAQQYQSLKDCGIAGRDYSINISEAWRNAFNFAHQKISDQGINSSLHFMEPDSGRTSLEERNSQSSGELLEAKDNDSGLIKVGLHQPL